MIEAVGALAICTIVASYEFEKKVPVFTLVFAGACAAAALYAFLIGSHLFMIAKGIWVIVAFEKWHIGIDQNA